MDDYRTFLAQQILTEDKVVTYRLLSRALKVHVNTAKEMLFDFHKWQNDKRPGSLNATYLVYGIQQKIVQEDEDVDMADSNSESELSPSEEVTTVTMTLVKDENLQDLLRKYDIVTSIQVYSLQAHPLKDVQVLADAAQSVTKMSLADDVTNLDSIYGTVSNPGVRRRARKGGLPKTVPTILATKAEPTPQPKQKQETKPLIKEEPKTGVSTSAPKGTVAKKVAAAPSLKRQGSSGGIGQMFAKAAAKPKKPANELKSNTASVPDEPGPVLSDEGEDDDSEMPEAKPDPEAINARKNRQAELRKMMEESDEEEEPEVKAEEAFHEDEPPEPEQPAVEEQGPAEIVSSTGDGRKRGRRRVTKKKQIMDEQGYLVTIQEQAWESFSEDEAPPPNAKIPKVEKAPLPSAKGKKSGPKGAQGNIMSFFSKK
ncbi:DNA polymerase subunit Cdc27 [Xylariales sp. PMI_506]|nr:DNA polymerase subunit Cdc27 [Xylariales sp. PMI_506]